MKISSALPLAAFLVLAATPAYAQAIPPAAGTWLQCAALGRIAEKGAPDAVARKAAGEIHRKYKELFVTFLHEWGGKSTTKKVVDGRVETSLKALVGDRKSLNADEKPQILACQRDLERLTSNIPETARRMAEATPKPGEVKQKTEMWATCAVAMGWAIDSGLSHDPKVRSGARRYQQMFVGFAQQQGMKKEEIETGFEALKKVAATKTPNELKSAIASCMRELP